MDRLLLLGRIQDYYLHFPVRGRKLIRRQSHAVHDAPIIIYISPQGDGNIAASISKSVIGHIIIYISP